MCLQPGLLHQITIFVNLMISILQRIKFDPWPIEDCLFSGHEGINVHACLFVGHILGVQNNLVFEDWDILRSNGSIFLEENQINVYYFQELEKTTGIKENF